MIAWVFYIQPKITDILQRGNLKADFNKKGKGREAFLEKKHQIVPLSHKINGSMKLYNFL